MLPLPWTPDGLLDYCPGKSGALYRLLDGRPVSKSPSMVPTVPTIGHAAGSMQAPAKQDGDKGEAALHGSLLGRNGRWRPDVGAGPLPTPHRKALREVPAYSPWVVAGAIRSPIDGLLYSAGNPTQETCMVLAGRNVGRRRGAASVAWVQRVGARSPAFPVAESP